MKVREASLDDTKYITAIHLTNPDRPFDRPVESLSIAECIGYGGDWMSVESCAIHLNNLIAWGCAPLVVEDGGKVIAEAEFYIGPDIPPLGTTLDISVIFVHSDFQRRGAGTMLMEEMISRAERGNCSYVTVSGGLGAPGFYARFGFEHLLDLQAIDCDVPQVPAAAACRCRPYVPADFAKPPECPLWIGRFLSPSQKWQEIVNGMRKRDIILRERAAWPEPIGRLSEGRNFLGFLIPWEPTHADVYCWAEGLTSDAISEMLTHARLAGYTRACLLCHPDVGSLVSEVCRAVPSRPRSIWGKKL